MPNPCSAIILVATDTQFQGMTAYLTVEAENQRRQLLAGKCDEEDLKAFMTLQQAAMAGRVQQESRELMMYSQLSLA